VIHGLRATGKSSIVPAVLEALDIPHTVIKSRECITGRHLLEQISLSCRSTIAGLSSQDLHLALPGRCESISVLENHLEDTLKHLETERFVLVLDGIDRQREAPSTLLPALARFGAIVRDDNDKRLELRAYWNRFLNCQPSSLFPFQVRGCS
jgi:origin recognition complex subunit 5